MKKLRVTVQGKVYDVTVELLEEGAAKAPALAPVEAEVTPADGSGMEVPSPLAGKVVSITAQLGQQVGEGDELMILEAMKMNTHVFAPSAGKVAGIHVQAGDNVEEGQVLVTLGA